MATKEQTRLERDITIIEQTLHAMIEIDPATVQIPSEDSQQSRLNATLL
ncbi:MAG: hypothetical protein ACXV2B_04620 [Halobacteriota archaeon]